MLGLVNRMIIVLLVKSAGATLQWLCECCVLMCTPVLCIPLAHTVTRQLVFYL